jgi:hypothetical protein
VAIFDTKQFSVRLQGHAIATWLGPRDNATIGRVLDLIRREKWKGQLQVDFGGDGGVSSIIFTEVRRMVETKEDLPY